ncbi:MAG: hypothetical protein EOP85_03175 [Verrucomicrobiaceae bacterium]|nr:MAG: hypothetical protein EOP85_03175 [Verrucomicrobiaceae bacterium]
MRFINVDLDILSGHPLDQLCRDLVERGMLLLHVGPHDDGFFARLETELCGYTSGPEEIICRFCDVLESLEGKAALEWESSRLRTFDLGYETTGSPPHSSSSLSHATLSRIVALGATIAFTFYHRSESES